MNRRAFLAAPTALTGCAIGTHPDPAPEVEIDRAEFDAFVAAMRRRLEGAPKWLISLINEAAAGLNMAVVKDGRIVPSEHLIRVGGYASQAMADLDRCKGLMT